MSIRLRLLLLLVSFVLLSVGGHGMVPAELWAQSPDPVVAAIPEPGPAFPGRLFLIGAGLAAAFCALGALELVRVRPREDPYADYDA